MRLYSTGHLGRVIGFLALIGICSPTYSNAQVELYSQVVHRYERFEVPDVVDPPEQLDHRELEWYLNNRIDGYQTTFEVIDGAVARYLFEPTIDNNPSERLPHERTDYCETTPAYTRCYDEAGGTMIDLPTDAAPGDADLFAQLGAHIGIASGGRLASRGVADPFADRDTVFTYDEEDGRLVGLAVAEPRHRIDYPNDETTVTTHYRYDALLDKVMPSNEVVKISMTTASGLPATRFSVTQYSPYFDPDASFADLREFDAVLYPNPASEVLNFRPEVPRLVERIEVHDLTGKLVRQTDAVAATLDVSDLRSGTYVITLYGVDAEPIVTPFNKL